MLVASTTGYHQEYRRGFFTRLPAGEKTGLPRCTYILKGLGRGSLLSSGGHTRG